MKKILSLSKMREVLPLPYDSGKAKSAVFLQNEETELSDAEYKFLAEKSDPFKYMVENGIFKVINLKDDSEKEKPVEKSLSKKEKKKLEKAEKAKAEKKAAEKVKEIKTKLNTLHEEKLKKVREK